MICGRSSTCWWNLWRATCPGARSKTKSRYSVRSILSLGICQRFRLEDTLFSTDWCWRFAPEINFYSHKQNGRKRKSRLVNRFANVRRRKVNGHNAVLSTNFLSIYKGYEFFSPYKMISFSGAHNMCYTTKSVSFFQPVFYSVNTQVRVINTHNRSIN